MTNTITLADRRLTRIGLGTNRLRNTPEHVAFIRAAVAAGVQMIDTAHLYTGGDSERAIGAALSPLPPSCMIASKAGFGGAGHGTPDVLRREIDESLARLGAKRVELYYLHRVDPETPIEVSLRTIAEYVHRGQIAHVGISEVTIDQIERARLVVPIAAVQNEYSLAERKHEAVIDYCHASGIVFVPFFPLRGADTPSVSAIAQHHGATPTQIALAWLLRRSPAMLPIPGTLSIGHLKQNLGALEIEISAQEFETLSGRDAG
jgi:pyridoxine 4-dehydrogenase